ncbi:hypothetical protein DFR50_1211, partial [Roseiarcus fermentans]
LRLAHMPTGEQNQKKRTFDVLPIPDNLIRYRHEAGRALPRPGFGRVRCRRISVRAASAATRKERKLRTPVRGAPAAWSRRARERGAPLNHSARPWFRPGRCGFGPLLERRRGVDFPGRSRVGALAENRLAGVPIHADGPVLRPGEQAHRPLRPLEDAGQGDERPIRRPRSSTVSTPPCASARAISACQRLSLSGVPANADPTPPRPRAGSAIPRARRPPLRVLKNPPGPRDQRSATRPAPRQLTPSFLCKLVDEVVYWNTSFLSG